MARRHRALRLPDRQGHPPAGPARDRGTDPEGDLPALHPRRLGTRAIATELNARGQRSRTGSPWAGYTIARILDNPAYTGDLVYGDVYVPDVHEPLIDRATYDHARQIVEARGDTHTQRAASPGDYLLTGLITCPDPDCGRRYIGTAARGRSRTYRYYTCFSRNRYGASGCSGTRAWTPTPSTPPSWTPWSPSTPPRRPS